MAMSVLNCASGLNMATNNLAIAIAAWDHHNQGLQEYHRKLQEFLNRGTAAAGSYCWNKGTPEPVSDYKGEHSKKQLLLLLGT